MSRAKRSQVSSPSQLLEGLSKAFFYRMETNRQIGIASYRGPSISGSPQCVLNFFPKDFAYSIKYAYLGSRIDISFGSQLSPLRVVPLELFSSRFHKSKIKSPGPYSLVTDFHRGFRI